jgi:peptide/nickel transport system permease protein
VVLAVMTVTFVLLRVAPGDPFATEDRFGSAEERAARRQAWGLDKPIHVQYVLYVSNIVRGNLGTSTSQHGRPAADALGEAARNTLILAVAALLFDFGLGVSLGVFQGVQAGTRFDRWTSSLSLAVFSTPTFVLGALLILCFVVKLRWFPLGGMQLPGSTAPLWSPPGLLDLLSHLALPALTLGLIGAAATSRYQRAEVLDVTRQDFMRTARAKGLTERMVLVQHALRNALLPTVTLLATTISTLLSGAVVVETVFQWPGMGYLTARAIGARDYDVVTGAAIVAAIVVTLANLGADLLYRWADPRTRA